MLARSLVIVSLLSAAAAPAVAAPQIPSAEALETGAAAVAKIVGSAVFLSGRSVDDVLATEFAAEDPISIMLRPLVRVSVDRQAWSIEVSLLGKRRRAVLRGRQGVGIEHVGADSIAGEASSIAPSPALDMERAWPQGDADALHALASSALADSLRHAVDKAFVGWAPPGDPRTRAVLVAHRDKIVAERYAAGFTARTRQHGWSMTKSVVDALVGLRSREGLIDVAAPTGLRQWRRGEDDPRAAITLEQLLRMHSGLNWREAYDGPGDGSGPHALCCA